MQKARWTTLVTMALCLTAAGLPTAAGAHKSASISSFYTEVRPQMMPQIHLNLGTDAKQPSWREATHEWGPQYCLPRACATEQKPVDDEEERYYRIKKAVPGMWVDSRDLKKKRAALRKCQMRECRPTHDPQHPIEGNGCEGNKEFSKWRAIPCMDPPVTYKRWYEMMKNKR